MYRSACATCVAMLVACGRSQPSAQGGPNHHGVAADASPFAPTTSASAGTPERYAGQPMLVIIDNYALSVIGALPPDKETSVRKIVKRTFGGDDDWRATVRNTMHWPPNVDAEILSNWATFKTAAKADGQQPDPVVFAQAFGDEFSKY